MNWDLMNYGEMTTNNFNETTHHSDYINFLNYFAKLLNYFKFLRWTIAP